MSSYNRQLQGDLARLRLRPVAAAPFLGGRPCLDFANTVSGWQASPPTQGFEPLEDRLGDYTDLLAWAQRAGLLDQASVAELWREAHRRPRDAEAVVARARRLRQAIYRTGRLLSGRVKPVDTDVEALLTEVQAARQHARLRASDTGLAWTTVADPRALDRVLWPIAQSAVDYFTTRDLSRLGVCPGEECGWLFEDTSRNRSRRWCDMADCGNLDKVRRFRSRRVSRGSLRVAGDSAKR